MRDFIRTMKTGKWFMTQDSDGEDTERHLEIRQSVREVASSQDSPDDDLDGPVLYFVDGLHVEEDKLSAEAMVAAAELLTSDGWVPA